MKNLGRVLALSLPLVGVLVPTSSPLYAQTVIPASTFVDFGSVNACPAGKTTPAPCNSTNTLSFNVSAGTTIGSIAIVTTGTPNLDFKAKADDSSTTLCKPQSYASATTCTVEVTFAPIAPGARNGAVQLLGGSGKVLATTLIYGTGFAPQIAFGPGTQITLPFSGLGLVGGIAVDSIGNVFATDYGGRQVVELPAGGGAQITLPFTGLDGPVGVAVDGAGDLFVADAFGDQVWELPSGGGAQGTLPFNGLSEPQGVAVDGGGDVFVPDYGNQRILEVPAGGSAQITLPFTRLGNATAVAVDAAQNIFGTGRSGHVRELPAGGGTQITLPFTGLVQPDSLAVDAAGDVFVADFAHGQVVELPVGGGSQTIIPFSALTSNDGLLFSVAVDAAGDVFAGVDVIARYASSFVVELQRTLPASLAFPTTTVGSRSQLSITVQNTGNSTLTGSGFSFTGADDFTLVVGSGTPQDCPANFSLPPSAECNLTVAFTPQSAGSVAGSLVVTDNAGNAATATQSIALSGIGAAPLAQVSPAVLQFGSVPYPGGSATLPLTVTNTGTGKLTIDPSSNGRGAVITGSTCGAGLSAGKSCTLQVEFKPVQLGLNTNTLTIQTNGVGGPQVPVRGIASGVGSVSTTLAFGTVKGRGNSIALPLTVTNFGVLGNVTVATETGATTFKILSNGCTAGITAGNSCTIEVEYAPVQQGTQTGYLKLIPSTGPEQIIVMVGALAP